MESYKITYLLNGTESDQSLITVPDYITDRALIRRAKAIYGLSGIKSVTIYRDRRLIIRQHGLTTSLIIEPA